MVYGLSNQAVSDSIYLAKVADKRLEKYQISDELLTAKIYGLAKIVKNQYQAVAGESEIRQQIYFNDWQNSLKAND